MLLDYMNGDRRLKSNTTRKNHPQQNALPSSPRQIHLL
jgi:hypothetical protein